MADLAARIREALDRHAEDESNEKLEARLAAIEEQRGSDFTKEELKRILGELDDDDRDEIMAALVGEEQWARAREGAPGSDPPGAGDPPAGDPPAGDPPATERRTRPGRKKGMLYDWSVDDDGNVVELDIATLYSGDDEDDEVELPPEPPAESDDDAAAAA